MSSKLYDLAQAARRTRVTPRSLLLYFRSGRIPADALIDGQPRWRASTLSAWMEARPKHPKRQTLLVGPDTAKQLLEFLANRCDVTVSEVADRVGPAHAELLTQLRSGASSDAATTAAAVVLDDFGPACEIDCLISEGSLQLVSLPRIFDDRAHDRRVVYVVQVASRDEDGVWYDVNYTVDGVLIEARLHEDFLFTAPDGAKEGDLIPRED